MEIGQNKSYDLAGNKIKAAANSRNILCRTIGFIMAVFSKITNKRERRLENEI